MFFKTILEKHMTFKYGQFVVEALCYKLERAVFKPGHLLSIISRLLKMLTLASPGLGDLFPYYTAIQWNHWFVLQCVSQILCGGDKHVSRLCSGNPAGPWESSWRPLSSGSGETQWKAWLCSTASVQTEGGRAGGDWEERSGGIMERTPRGKVLLAQVHEIQEEHSS